MTHVLQIRGLSLRIDGVPILDDVDLDVDATEIVALVGPNGAGKTSLLNCIGGVYRPRAGRIHFRGQDVTHQPPHAIARLAIGRTFQHAELFPTLSVADNLLAGRHRHFRTWAGLPRRAEEGHQRAAIRPVLRFLELEALRDVPVAELPFGQQKLVGVGRALALQPDLLLLDEPSAGMHARDRVFFARVLVRVRSELALPVLWIEHDMELVAELATRVIVLDAGRVIASGPPENVLRDPAVVRAYLGRSAAMQ